VAAFDVYKSRKEIQTTMSKLRVLALAFFAAFALSAVAAESAQAGWLVLGSLLVGSAAIASGAVIVEEGVLGFKSGTEAVTISCPTSLEVNGGTISEPDKVLVTSLVFGGCKVTSTGNCSLEPTPTTVGTLPVEGLVTLDGPLAVKAKLKPENAADIFATFKLKGTGCSLAGKVPVTGEASILAPTGQDERLWQLVKAFEATAGELEVASGAATISGSALFKLASDMPWSFD
jgi:hypothetical protein